MKTTTERPEQTGDTAYKTWIGHTHTCSTCRAGAPCPTAAKLGRAWRDTRR
ncbi:hypothetical protein [Streptomyces sp. NPDC096095]|uniref:hypothetical protein n=1 Tax=Streptomyces sp. NPDC096095 TaxID=3155545 RepID=UPI00331F846D